MKQIVIFYSLFLSGVLFFLYGFIDLNAVQSNSNVPIKYNHSSIRKVILIVIDALRYDMIISDDYFNVQNALKVLVKLETPSVTLPRIKSLVSGNVPGFLDVLFNIKSSEIKEDNIIKRLLDEKSFKIEFYGDDTWLKLFPNAFTKIDGTSSFYVKDYYEVDDNVTRHIDDIIHNQRRWDMILMHYLGLDHIGHVEGPKSSVIFAKLVEMDIIFKKIVNNLLNNDTLIILTGDHGMSDLGGHGGATYHELNTGAIFVHPKFSVNKGNHFQKIHQTDLCTAIALLNGVTIPKDSIGVFPYDLLKLLPNIQMKSEILILNFQHLIKLIPVNLQMGFLKTFNEVTKTTGSYKLYDIYKLNKLLQSTIKSNSGINNPLNVVKMEFGISLQIYSLINLISVIKNKLFIILISSLIPLLLFFGESYLQTFILCVILWFCFKTKPKVNFRVSSFPLNFIFIIPVLQFCSMFSSSFVEEEHQFWYFISTCLCLYLFFRDLLDYIMSYDNKIDNGNICLFVVLMTIDRFIRKINQTGDKWAHLADLADFLNKEPTILLTLLGISIISIVLFCPFNSIIHKTIVLIISILNFSHRFMNINKLKIDGFNIDIAIQICYGLLVFLFLLRLVQKRNSIYISYLLLLFVSILCRNHNLIVLLSYCIKQQIIHKIINNSKHQIPASAKSILYYTLGMVSFYQWGNSHSITTIDMQTGYVGLSSYQPIIAALFITVHTWIGLLYWLLSLCELENRNNVQMITSSLLIMPCLSCIAVCMSCCIMRHHLFVWSVFTPRLLYASFNILIIIPFFVSYQILIEQIK